MLALENREEKELLIAIAEGSESAFRQLYMQYHHKLGAFIFRITESRETSEEIVQDVFLKIWQNRADLPDIQSIKAYLLVMSKNQALNCLKKAVAERVGLLKLGNYYDQFDSVDSINTEVHKYLLLDEAIEKLPAQQKKVYILSRHKRLKYAQIAKETNLSEETVKKYLKIATSSIINRMRESMPRELIELSVIFFLIFSKN